MAAMNGLNTAGIQAIQNALNAYQKDLNAVITSAKNFECLTSHHADAQYYFANSAALKNFTKETDVTYKELQDANAKLKQYLSEFNQVAANYKTFGDQSATTIAASMKS